MKTIIRNFLSVLRRFKMATLLNIAGLTVAFAAFIIILMQVRYEYNFDRFHPNANKIYRVDLTLEGVIGMVQSRPFINEFVNSSPHIKAGGLIFAMNMSSYFYLDNELKNTFRESVSIVDPGFVKVFGFPVVQGDPDCLNDPEKVLIPQSMATRLFGDEFPVGKSILMDEGMWMTNNRKQFTVGAVYADFPGNTQLENGIFMSIAKEHGLDDNYSHNYFCYVLLDDTESVKQVEDNFNSYYDFSQQTFDIYDAAGVGVKLFPVVDIYYNQPPIAEIIIKTGSRETAIVLVCIALFVVIIAAINFTNFSTSLAPLRIKSINTQKVLGSSDHVLKIALLSEAVIISCLSCLFSIGLVNILQKLAVFSFIEADLKLVDNMSVVFATVLLSVLVGIMAGLYPARYMTSFPPALVLKGSFGLSPKGRRLRTGLMGFQFVVSIVLIIVTLFVYLQRNYIKHYTVGFDKDQVAVVEIGEKVYGHNKDVYINKLKSYPGIEDVAFAVEQIGGRDMYSMNMFKYLGEDILYFQLIVSPNIFSVLGIDIVEGRAPREKEEGEKFVFSHSTKEKYALSTGWIDMHGGRNEIVGFAKDISLTSLRQSNYNVAFISNQNQYFPFSYIRLKAGTDYRAAVDHIRSTIQEIDPNYPVQVNFYDELFNGLYQKEENLNKMISLFSLLAIIISMVGVFGLVVFETQYRKKEIGLRKVMGAEVRDILIMFNKTYFNIVVVCFLIGAPIAWYSAARWLENFADKTPMYAWVYAVAFLIIVGIVMTTVTLQNWRAATDNPVDSIKAE